MNSKQKGKRGELELCHELTERGYPARRGQQYNGADGSADILCERLYDYHIECKRTERFQIYEAMKQATTDALKRNKTPVVMHRKNKGEWMVVMPLRSFLDMVEETKGWMK